MARQDSINEILGTIGNLTYYKRKDGGYRLKRKSSISASRIKTEAAFVRTRENMSDFGRAGQNGKVLRKSVRSLLVLAKDLKVVSRLVKLIMAIFRTDTTSARGARNIISGDTTLLKGFDFNVHGKLGATFFAPYSDAIDRAAGTLTLTIPAFDPALMIAAPEGTTHFRIVSAGSEVDFVNEIFNTDIQQTAILPWNDTATSPISAVHTVTAASTLPLLMHLGIQFFQLVGGTYYPLKNGAFNSLNIIDVDVP
jgi:hypothetical protein